MNVMRRLPSLLAGLFIVLNIGRVAAFAGDRMEAGGFAGFIFSAGMAAGVFGVSYWTRVSGVRTVTRKDRETGERRAITEEVPQSRSVRLVAWFLVIVFILADGFFNMAEVLLTVNPEPGDILTFSAAFVYGLFPTIGAAALGVLQGFIDRLPAESRGKRVTVAEALTGWVVRALGGASPDSERAEPDSGGQGGQVTGQFGQLTGPGGDWRKLSESDRRAIFEMSTAEIAQRYGVDDRTARRWSAKVRSNGFHKEEVSA